MLDDIRKTIDVRPQNYRKSARPGILQNCAVEWRVWEALKRCEFDVASSHRDGSRTWKLLFQSGTSNLAIEQDVMEVDKPETIVFTAPPSSSSPEIKLENRPGRQPTSDHSA